MAATTRSTHFPAISSGYLRTALDPILSELQSINEAPPAGDGAANDRQQLIQALDQLIDVVARMESAQTRHSPAVHAAARSGASAPAQEITELSEYAFALLTELHRSLAQLGLSSYEEPLMELATSFALWVSRHNGELLSLEPVVDALAFFANNTSDAAQLEELCAACEEIVAAVASPIRQDLQKIDPRRPWRLLNMNRAIVATRSHNTKLMETAFESLIKLFPDDAAMFFQEGMQQMDALQYPSHVRAIMERYYSEYTQKKPLH